MEKELLLTIAGFDGSSNAGFIADIKTFEAHKLDALCVNTANTIQTDSKFIEADFFDFYDLKKQLDPLLGEYKIAGVKIGIIKNFETLYSLLCYLRERLGSEIPIVWDPILSSSTGFVFHKVEGEEALAKIIELVSISTPNLSEFESAPKSVWFKNNCYVKSYDKTKDDVVDLVFVKGKETFLKYPKIENHEKHGSGCVFSASLLANLALKNDLIDSLKNAGSYLSNYLKSSPTLRGVHVG
jgi:hydroxymethylpyrimidine/phosphomethylpyrimidine kinase